MPQMFEVLSVLGHAFTSNVSGFVIGRSVLMRDVGLHSAAAPEDVPFQEQDQARRTQDMEQKRRVHRPNSADEDLLVITQPIFEKVWKSMEDILNSIAGIAAKRPKQRRCASPPVQ
jgi:hypothetical protein